VLPFAGERVNWNELHEGLDARGWYAFSPHERPEEGALTERIHDIARLLGEIVPGRDRQLIERVVPRQLSEAFSGSLSSVYGLKQLPLHTDTAHWPTPCRFLILACLEVGPLPVPTDLLDSYRMTLSDDNVAACRRAPFLVRNGKRSFYSSIVDEDRQFMRFDRGCMTPCCKQGRTVLEAFDPRRHAPASHEWKRGDILVINNWRVLHGRGGERTAPGRVLLRAMIQ
jgi:alpha-ketoglutarate-dependent taurine dioxygenase